MGHCGPVAGPVTAPGSVLGGALGGERIVIGVDGSDGSVLALCSAVKDAAAHEAVLELVTVWESPYDFGEKSLDRVATTPWPGESASKRSWPMRSG